MSDTRVPKASILLASYNHARFVTQAVESVWAQTWRDIELIAIDDGSTDKSASILRELASNSPVPMIVEVQENRGLTQTLNRALSLARGNLICLLASDDYYHPRFVERNVAEAERQSGPVILHSDGWLIDESGTVGERVYAVSTTPPAKGKCFEAFATVEARVLAGTVVLPKRVIEEAGGYDAAMRCEDYDLYLRLSREIPFVFVNEPLYYSREVRGSLGRKPWVWAEGTIAALARHREFLGARYDQVLLKRLTDISYFCFVHGGFGHGLGWARRAIMSPPAQNARATTAARLLEGMISGTVQHLARSAIPSRPRKFVGRGLRRLLANVSSSEPESAHRHFRSAGEGQSRGIEP